MTIQNSGQFFNRSKLYGDSWKHENVIAYLEMVQKKKF